MIQNIVWSLIWLTVCGLIGGGILADGYEFPSLWTAIRPDKSYHLRYQLEMIGSSEVSKAYYTTVAFW